MLFDEVEFSTMQLLDRGQDVAGRESVVERLASLGLVRLGDYRLTFLGKKMLKIQERSRSRLRSFFHFFFLPFI